NGALRLRTHNDDVYPDEKFSAEEIDRVKLNILAWIFCWATLNSRRNAMLVL
ncbi:transcriptional regulator, partial [Pseudomonas syringae pv. tagetis]